MDRFDIIIIQIITDISEILLFVNKAFLAILASPYKNSCYEKPSIIENWEQKYKTSYYDEDEYVADAQTIDQEDLQEEFLPSDNEGDALTNNDEEELPGAEEEINEYQEDINSKDNEELNDEGDAYDLGENLEDSQASID